MQQFNVFVCILVSIVLGAIFPTLIGDERTYALGALEMHVTEMATGFEAEIHSLMDVTQDIEKGRLQDPSGQDGLSRPESRLVEQRAFEKDPAIEKLYELERADDSHLRLLRQWNKKEAWSLEKLDEVLSTLGVTIFRLNTQPVIIEPLPDGHVLVAMQNDSASSIWVGVLELDLRTQAKEAGLVTLLLLNDLGQPLGSAKRRFSEDYLSDLATQLWSFQQDFGSTQWQSPDGPVLVFYKRLAWEGLSVVGWMGTNDAFAGAFALGKRLFILLLGLILVANGFWLKQAGKIVK